MVSRALFTSESEEWSTPDDLYAELNEEFGFVLDAAASHENAKCATYFTKVDDALAEDWARFGGPVFLNPPFRPEERPCKPGCTKQRCAKKGAHVVELIPGTYAFIAKAKRESAKVPVVLELPSRTDTDWFHAFIWDVEHRCFRPRTEVRFGRGRRRYGGAKSGAPFPSATVVFHPPWGGR